MKDSLRINKRTTRRLLSHWRLLLRSSSAAAFFFNFVKSVDEDERVLANNLSKQNLPPHCQLGNFRKDKIAFKARSVQAHTVPKIAIVKLFMKNNQYCRLRVQSSLGVAEQRPITIVIVATCCFPEAVFSQNSAGRGNCREFFKQGRGIDTRWR